MPAAINPTGNIFITGATGGIGSATAHALTAAGYRVYAGVRGDAPDLAEDAAIRLVRMDVTDPESVEGAAADVADSVGDEGLHAVVNAAGLIVQGPLELIAPERLQEQFSVNTLGPAYVVASFLPLIRAGRGRIINVSAPTARIPVPFMAPIAASKAALNSWSDALRGELAPWRIPVVIVEPGATDTRIFAKATAAAESDYRVADDIRLAGYRSQLAAISEAASSQKLGPADVVAETIVTAVTANRPKRRYAAGAGAQTMALVSHLPAGLRERLIARAFGLRKADSLTAGPQASGIEASPGHQTAGGS